MTKPEWGIKRLCANCSARYYDLKKTPPVCPSCGTTFDPEALLKSRRRMVAAEVPSQVKVKKVEADEIEVEEVDEDADDVVDAADDVDPDLDDDEGDIDVGVESDDEDKE